MLVARGRLERRQAIISIGLQQFVPAPDPVMPIFAAPTHQMVAYRALVDTGAQRTCLTRSVIAGAGLIRIGKLFIKNVHSEALHSKFLANIAINTNGVSSHREPVIGCFGLPEPVEVIDIDDNARFDAILGMDVLEKFDMRFERSGDFELAIG